MALEAERLRRMFSSKQRTQMSDSSGVATGQLVEGSEHFRVQELTANTSSGHKDREEKIAPQIEMPEWEKKLDKFK
jgi:hypothetical protein